VKDVQRDPIKQIIEHIDLLTVRQGEKVTVDIPVHVVGEVAPGNAYNQELTVISLEAEATHLPTAVEVDIEGRTAGQHIHASDLVLPKGAVLLADADALVVNISEATEAGEEGAEEAAGAASEAAAE
jgi:large subunit ribosomal protein L25